MCGSDTYYEDQRNERLLAQRQERELEQQREQAKILRAKRARAAKRAATILKAKRVKAAKKGAATRAAKKLAAIPVHQTLTVILKPDTIAQVTGRPKTSVIPRGKAVIAKARPLRTN